MHHLGIGIEHRGKRVIMIVDHIKVAVVDKRTGEVLSEHQINPSKIYWTNMLMDAATKKSRKRR